MRLLFLFIDGLGLGRNSNDNPLVFTPTPGISGILGGQPLTADAAGCCGAAASLLSLDATLGVPGLPQSATGQASIFTGINAAALVGEHLNGQPGPKLRKLLSSTGIFSQLRRKGCRAAFANAYRPPFFDLLRMGLPGIRYSCSTLVAYYGGQSFFSLADLSVGRALYMDITNRILDKLGFTVPLISAEEGASRLIEISRNYHFTLFEYFLSDLVGHLADREEAERVVKDLDQFIGGLAARIDPEHEFMIVVSDHGNLEDLSGRDHTLNGVPALLVGNRKLRSKLQGCLEDLTDLLPAVQAVLDWN